MTAWVTIWQVSAEQDLSNLRSHLQQYGIGSYVFEAGGNQCLCVPADTDQVLLQRALARWNQDDRLSEPSGNPDYSGRVRMPAVLSGWQYFPLTLVLILLSLISYLLVATPLAALVGGRGWLAALSFQAVSIAGDDVLVKAGWPGLAECWRYWSPVFLHFSLMHILFNGLMLLELGRRIETVQGSRRLSGLVLVCGGLSNIAQYLADPLGIFGGMSGVIYGLVGYCWLYQRLRPDSRLQMPAGLMTMSVFWLLLCFSGLVTWAGMGNIANAAHVGGLLAGLVAAWLCQGFERLAT